MIHHEENQFMYIVTNRNTKEGGSKGGSHDDRLYNEKSHV